MSQQRMAGGGPMLPKILAAMGLIPADGKPLSLSDEEKLVAAAIGGLSQSYAPGVDPRDYRVEPGLWASQLLPEGISISQAIKDGIWRRTVQ